MRPGRGRARAYLLGAAGLLVAELAVTGVLLLPPATAPTVVAGVAEPAPVATQPGRRVVPPAPPPEPAAERAPATRRSPTGTAAPADAPAPATLPGDESPGRPPGTIRLPDGGTARLVRGEVGPDAVLPVPDDLGEATWWGAGVGAPGGASVFAGHVDWNGRTGPFAELWAARIGERVTVVDEAGTAWNYDITRIVTLAKDELPARAGELFGQSGPHRIVLVTCGGRWLGGTTGYAENRVVLAEPG
ncbi:class F sortase [Qaidamihabitans albus]|uniref:class F sortase n=1 Tax=Qaidamihabitans albus TaxID=2795733 RepID=UPI0018F1BDE6|nr:class F sortase [Qaidamihabitans albus]